MRQSCRHAARALVHAHMHTRATMEEEWVRHIGDVYRRGVRDRAPSMRGAKRAAAARRLRDALGGMSVDDMVCTMEEFERSGYTSFEFSTAERFAGYVREKGGGAEEWPWIKSVSMVSLCGHGMETSRMKELMQKTKELEEMFSRGECSCMVPVILCMYNKEAFLTKEQAEGAFETMAKVEDTVTFRLMEAIVYSVTKPGERMSDMAWTRTNMLRDYEAECVLVGEGEVMYFAERGSTDPYEGWGVCGSNDGGIFYRGEFSRGQPHGTCVFFDIEERGAVFTGRVVNGEPCGRGELTYGHTGAVERGLFDAKCNMLNGRKGLDIEERPGYQTFTLSFVDSGNTHVGMYAMDTGMGDVSYCDADEAEEYARAAEAAEEKERNRRILTTRAVAKRTPVETKRARVQWGGKYTGRASGARSANKKGTGSQQASASSNASKGMKLRGKAAVDKYEESLAKGRVSKSAIYDLRWLQGEFEKKTEDEVDALLDDTKANKKRMPKGCWYYLGFRMWMKVFSQQSGQVHHDDVCAMCMKTFPRFCGWLGKCEIRSSLMQKTRSKDPKFPNPGTDLYDMHRMEGLVQDLRSQQFFKQLHGSGEC
jgi:hypothetical protein